MTLCPLEPRKAIPKVCLLCSGVKKYSEDVQFDGSAFVSGGHVILPSAVRHLIISPVLCYFKTGKSTDGNGYSPSSPEYKTSNIVNQ